MNKSVKNEMLEKLLAKRKGLNEALTSEFEGGFTPYQQSVFLAALSDVSHQNYLIHLLLKLSKPLDRTEMITLLSKLFTTSPALCLRVVEKENGFLLEKQTFQEKEITFDSYISEDQITLDSESVTIPVTDSQLFRLVCYEKAGKVQFIRFAFHHLLIDGTGIDIFHHRIESLLNGENLKLDTRFESFAIECKQQEVSLRKRAREFALKSLTSDFTEILPHNKKDSSVRRVYSLNDKGLDEFCKSWQITRPGLLYGCLALALSAVTRNFKVNLGTVAENRGPKDADALGCFINTMLLSYDFTGIDQFKSLIEASKSTMLGLLEANDVPFVYLREEMQQLGWSKDQLFQVFVNYVDESASPINSSFDLALIPSRNNKFDLNLIFHESKGNLTLTFDGKLSTSLEWIDAFQMIFQEILSGCLKNPEDSIKRPDLFFRPILTSSVNFEADLLLNEFEEFANQSPERPFILSSQISLSYREAVSFSDKVCCRLQELKLPKGGRVGIVLDRSPFFVPACLGVWKAGGSYVPIDVRLNTKRKSDIISYASLTCIIALDEDPELPKPDFDIKDILQTTGSANRSVAPSPQDEAYVLFTSGSTGTPKGVSVSHGNISHYTRSLGNYLGQESLSGLTFGVVSTPAADLGNTSIFLALHNGGALAQFAYEEVLRDDLFQDLMEKLKVDVLKIVPSHFVGLFANQQMSALPRKMIIFGGERLSSDLVRNLRAIKPDLRICNHYGPTETTVGVFCHEISEVPDSGYIPLGRPFGNTQVVVLDHQKRFLPSILQGELTVYGPSVSLGYINGTVPSFGRDEFGPYYRTGDLVHALNGDFYYLGREDDQIKINGVRVDLSELDFALRKICGLTKFHILYHRSGFYIFHTEDLPWTQEIVRGKLSHNINILLVPSGFLRINQIPVGPNGKVDKLKLIRLLDQEQRPWTTELSIQLNPKVLDAWEKAFGPLKSLQDTVFQSGGSSLVAARILSRLNREFGANISLGLFLKSPTILSLNQLISSIGNRTQDHTKLSSTELTPFQQRMWFLNRLNPQDPSYNVPLLLNLRPGIKLPDLKEFFRRLFLHFVILQARFMEEDGKVRMYFDDDFSTAYFFSDSAELQNVYAKNLQEGTDLLKERPFRILHSPDMLLISFHHIITDGISNKFFLGVLDSFLSTGEIDFTLYPRLLNHKLPSFSSSQVDFWKSELQGFSALDFSLHRATPGNGVSTREIILNEGTKDSISSWCKTNGVFPKDYFLGLLTLTLSYAFNSPRFYQLTAINTRNDEDEYLTLGASIDTMLFGFDVRPQETLLNFIKRVKKTFWDFHQHTSVPFSEQLRVHKLVDHDGALIPNYMFAFESGGESYKNISPDSSPKLEAKFPLTITVYDLPEHFRVELSSREQILDISTLDRISQIIQNLINESFNSDFKVLQLPFSKNLKVCSYEGPATQGPLLLEAFRSQVFNQPGKPCVIDSESSLTFDQVNQLSDELAAKLYCSYGNNKLLGLHLPRSTQLIVAILAILKSGNAFSPIDKTTPLARLAQVSAEVDLLIDERMFLNLIQEKKTGNDLPRIDPDSIAYCIFTSGSTGKPKAVPISHRAISNYLQWAQEEFLGFDQGPIPLISSLNYDLTVTSYLLPLSSGRTCRIFRSESILAALNEFAQSTEAWSLVKMTPSHLRIIKDQLLNSNMKIKSLILGGESLESALVSGLHQVEQFYNEYGPAETTIGVTVQKFNSKDLTSGSCPIGNPVANTSIELTGFLDLPVLPLTKGRLLIRGIQVFEGYRGDSKRTNGVYDSGDLAFENNGKVFYIGRDDGQIKISGNRIEIGEMNVILQEFFPFISFQLEVIKYQGQQMVVLIFDGSPEETLVAMATKQFLDVHPAHLLPERFISKVDLRVLDSGKTDWEATLRQSTPQIVGYHSGSADLEMISSLWKRILNLEKVDPDLNFFDAGGTSLSLVRLLAEIKLISVQNVTMVDLLRFTTIRQQSKLLQESSNEPGETTTRSRKKVDMRKRN